MEFACFYGHALALDYRAGRGGWVFLAGNGRGFWFDPALTASEVLTHPCLRGLSGLLR